MISGGCGANCGGESDFGFPMVGTRWWSKPSHEQLLPLKGDSKTLRDALRFPEAQDSPHAFTYYSSYDTWPVVRSFSDAGFRYGLNLLQKVKRSMLTACTWKKFESDAGVTMRIMLNQQGVQDEAIDACSQALQGFFQELIEAERFVKHVESNKAVLQL